MASVNETRKMDESDVVTIVARMMERAKSDIMSEVDSRLARQPAPVVEAKPKMMPETPAGMHPGRFEHIPLTDTLEDVYCPTCGTIERTPIKVKEVVKETPVEKIPAGYVKVASARDAFDIVRAGHADGKKWYECDNCKAGVIDFLKGEGDGLKAIGFDIKEVKKK